jgi:hypothetical protein
MKKRSLLAILAIPFTLFCVQGLAERMDIISSDSFVPKAVSAAVRPEWRACRKSAECTVTGFDCDGRIPINESYREAVNQALEGRGGGGGCLATTAHVFGAMKQMCFLGRCEETWLAYIWPN